MLSPSYLVIIFVSSLLWYEALSHRKTVSSCHPGVSLSNYFINDYKNSWIIFESVFAWDNVNQTRPSVSSAAIIDILGDTLVFIVFPRPFLSAQVFRIKFVPFSQVSSMFMTLVYFWRSVSMVNAYCWRRTRFFATLA